MGKEGRRLGWLPYSVERDLGKFRAESFRYLPRIESADFRGVGIRASVGQEDRRVGIQLVGEGIDPLLIRSLNLG
ncbi:MAG: hypothetical protein AAGJ31_09200, partial [Verrucomicrobiota bacterium]